MVGARDRAQQPVRHDAALPDHGLRPCTYSMQGLGVGGVGVRGRWGRGQGSVG